MWLSEGIERSSITIACCLEGSGTLYLEGKFIIGERTLIAVLIQEAHGDEGKIVAGPREHVVARGESLALIAQRYQISLAALRSANKLNGDVIKVGQTLQIPATSLAAQ